MNAATAIETEDTSRLLQLLRIEQAEARPLLLLWIHSLFVGIAIVPLYVAANTLFLAHLPASSLPYAYMVSALLGVLAGVLYRQARRRLTVSRVFTGLLLTLLLCLLLLRIGLEVMQSAWPAFLLLGFQSVSKALLSVELWGIAGQVFNVRQGKRLFGLIGSGELLATVIGGFATPWIVAAVGTRDLLLVSAAGIAGAIVVLQAIVRGHASQLRRSQEREDEEPQTDGVIALGRHPYVRSLFALSLVGVASHRLIDFAFLNQARERIQGQDDLAQLFGILFGVAQGLTFLLLTLVTGPVISRYGITRAMRPRRRVLTACVIGILIAIVTAADAGVLFWLAVAAKVADLVLLGALTAPAFLVLYQPLRPNQRLATQVAVDGVVGPVASGAAAGVLVILAATVGGGPLALSTFTLALLIGWRFISSWVDRGYRRALPEALQHRRLEGVSLSLDDSEMEQVLRTRLQSQRPHEVLYAFDLLTTRFDADLSELSKNLVRHTHPEIRREVARRLAQTDAPELEQTVRDQIAIEAEPRVQAALLLALAASAEADAVDDLSPFINDPSDTVAESAMIGLLQTGGVDGILVAGERLLSLERSLNPEERLRAARVLGEVGNRGFYRHLRPLLSDVDPVVRTAALTAAGKVCSPRLWPDGMASLHDIALHRTAAAALVAGGDVVLPLLFETLSDPQQHIHVRCRALPSVGRSAAIQRLMSSNFAWTQKIGVCAPRSLMPWIGRSISPRTRSAPISTISSGRS
ncbi:MAG: hypothetical protein HOE86_05960 [Gemmatimonadetes bacterium]|nr:hypothetical protein [Gemmatimonadota bacterium]